MVTKTRKRKEPGIDPVMGIAVVGLAVGGLWLLTREGDTPPVDTDPPPTTPPPSIPPLPVADLKLTKLFVYTTTGAEASSERIAQVGGTLPIDNAFYIYPEVAYQVHNAGSVTKWVGSYARLYHKIKGFPDSDWVRVRPWGISHVLTVPVAVLDPFTSRTIHPIGPGETWNLTFWIGLEGPKTGVLESLSWTGDQDFGFEYEIKQLDSDLHTDGPRIAHHEWTFAFKAKR